MCGRNSLCNFEFVVHIEASLGLILGVFFTLLLGCPLAFSHFEISVKFQSRGVVLSSIPGYVGVVIIFVHS